MIMIMNEHGHYYSPDTHTLYDDNGKAITHFSDASELFEKLSENDQLAISNLVSRAYKAGRINSEIIYKKKIMELFGIEED